MLQFGEAGIPYQQLEKKKRATEKTSHGKNKLFHPLILNLSAQLKSKENKCETQKMAKLPLPILTYEHRS